MDDQQTTQLVAFVLIMVFAIPLHEFGHALAAEYCGDDVPSLQGRVTLEPWAHWDFWGSILIAISIFSGFKAIGWGKPVQTDPTHYRNGKLGWLLVSVAGILVNLLLAAVGAGCYRLLHMTSADPFFEGVLQTFVLINISLAIFNLIPIPPLDGSKIVIWSLPGTTAIRYEQAFMGVGIVLLYGIVYFAHPLISAPVNVISRALLGSDLKV